MEEEKTETKEDQSSRALIPGSIILAGLIIASAVLYTSANKNGLSLLGSPAEVRKALSENIEKNPDLTDDDPFLGNPDAPVTVVEFSDFQCPYCRSFFEETEPRIIEQYVKTGKVKFVYRDFPLTGRHEHAQKAAEAGECADEQSKFWEYHDLIFRRQNELGAENFKAWARELGMNAEQFDACLDSGKYLDEVRDDFEDGQSFGVNGTPAVFVNGSLVPGGARPFSVFRQIIEEELAKR